MVLSNERAPALASSVSNQGRNCAKDLFVFCWMEYRLHLMVLPSVLILYLASISHPLYLEQVLSNSESWGSFSFCEVRPLLASVGTLWFTETSWNLMRFHGIP
jgi:hypothetical protein